MMNVVLKTVNKTYEYSVEELWANINTGFYNLDVRTEEVRATISKAERIYKIGVLATGEIREMSATGHYYDGEAVEGERLEAIVAYIKKEADCGIELDGNRITNIKIYRVESSVLTTA